MTKGRAIGVPGQVRQWTQLELTGRRKGGKEKREMEENQPIQKEREVKKKKRLRKASGRQEDELGRRGEARQGKAGNRVRDGAPEREHTHAETQREMGFGPWFHCGRARKVDGRWANLRSRGWRADVGGLERRRRKRSGGATSAGDAGPVATMESAKDNRLRYSYSE